MTSAKVAGLHIAPVLCDFVRDELVAGLEIDADRVWRLLAVLHRDFTPRGDVLLTRRDQFQRELDLWWSAHPGGSLPGAQRAHLEAIGYLLPRIEPQPLATPELDPEVSRLAGPQLVVPLDNARYALNAANARWVSLYDTLYGSDVVDSSGGAEAGDSYNAVRGERVVRWATAWLDQRLPLAGASHADVTSYQPRDEADGCRLVAETRRGVVQLADPDAFAGYVLGEDGLRTLVLRHHGLHVELQFDRRDPIGALHPAGLKDVVLEAALSTIVDCEDSVAAVDAEDKTRVYRNWLGLMRGTLQATFEKGGRSVVRDLAPDRCYRDPRGGDLTLPGRALLAIRNVGLHMTTDAVTDETGLNLPEGLLDAVVTVVAALHDLRGSGPIRNSRRGSVYVVKPKLHGPEEVALVAEVFARIEQELDLPVGTVKLGVMDEERRTSLNLRHVVAAVRDRLFFVNTGFLDRTGDEIHALMRGGPVLRKGAMKQAEWLSAYERNNVAEGLRAGFLGRAQVGKGMWTMPDRMAAMLGAKAAQLQSGASTAWVPSPTAAAVHALHYHEVDALEVQRRLLAADFPDDETEGLLTPCLCGPNRPSPEQVRQELDLNCQSILGYVVRWVQQGVGCSKVPDLENVGLMEDRATLRISSQLLANWRLHGLVSGEELREAMHRMAAVVDGQNAGDPAYEPMAPRGEASPGLAAALELVLTGADEPNGYTERVLTKHRREVKARAG